MCERFKRSYDVGMKGDEERVIQAFCAFLREQGWSTKREVGFIDVIAQKDGHRISSQKRRDVPPPSASTWTRCLGSCFDGCRRSAPSLRLASPLWCQRKLRQQSNGCLGGFARNWPSMSTWCAMTAP